MNTISAAHHRTIMAVDIAGYNNPSRTLAHLRQVHEGLWSVLKSSFAETGVPWDVCFVENTGDGAMILLPPEIAKADLVAQLPERLHAELRRYNVVHSEAARIQLRVALNAGEVQWGGQGAVGKAISATFRILDAPAAKAAQKATGADLALLASAMFYDDVVAQDPAAEPGEYTRIPVSFKETSTIAWLRLMGASEARRVAAPEAAPDLTALVEALMDVPWVRNSDSRRLLLEMFPRREIASQVSYHPQDRLHVIALARTCLRFEGGLQCLLDAVMTIDPHSPEVSRLTELIARWQEDRSGPEPAPDKLHGAQFQAMLAYFAHLQLMAPNAEREDAVKELADLVIQHDDRTAAVVETKAARSPLVAFQDELEGTTLGTPEARELRRQTTPEQAAVAVSRSEEHLAPSPVAHQQARQEFAEALRRLREQTGLSIRALEARSGVPRSTIAGYLTGQHLPTHRALEGLLLALNITDRDEIQMWLQLRDALAAPLERSPRIPRSR